jgi:hypothetical protein
MDIADGRIDEMKLEIVDDSVEMMYMIEERYIHSIGGVLNISKQDLTEKGLCVDNNVQTHVQTVRKSTRTPKKIDVVYVVEGGSVKRAKLKKGNKVQKTHVIIHPRYKRRAIGDPTRHRLGRNSEEDTCRSNEALECTLSVLKLHFDKPLYEASQVMGFCSTTIKRCCRKLGISKWPFQRIKRIRQRICFLRKLSFNLRFENNNIDRDIRVLQDNEAKLLSGAVFNI